MKFLTIMMLSLSLILTGCASDGKNNKTYAGAGIGGVVGAGVGAVLGKKKGAVIGAVLGAGIGGLAGRRMDKQAQELEKIAETKRTEKGLITKLKSDILFDTGKATLKPEAKTNLQQMAAIIKKYPEDVLTVKGYTDSTGSAKINEELSIKRADAVKQEMLVAGLTNNALTSRGMGPSEPIADNSTSTGRQQNRRVEIEVTVDESKIPKDAK